MPKNKEKNWLKLFFYGLLGIIFLDFLRSAQSRRIKANFSQLLEEEEEEIAKFTKRKNIFNFSRRFFSHLNDYFIPGAHNNHHPKILRKRSLALLTLGIFVFKALFVFYIFFVFPYSAKMGEDMVKEIYNMVNTARLSQGLDPLSLDGSLSESARAKAENMVQEGYFEHTSPDGRKPWDFIKRSDYAYLYVGENLAMNFTSAASAHNALMLSPGHKKNILSEKYQDVGLAIVSGQINGRKTNVLVQMFAARKAPAPVLASAADTKNAGLTEAKEIAPVPAPAESKPVAGIAKPAAPEPAVRKEEAPEAAETAVQALSASPEVSTQADIIKNAPSQESLPEKEVKKTDKPELVQEFSEYQDSVVSQRIGEVPNLGILNQDYKALAVNNIDNENGLFSRSFRFVDKALSFVLAVLVIAFVLNVIIRAEVQHKPVIIQSLFVILLIAGLLSIRFEAMAQLLPEIIVMGL